MVVKRIRIELCLVFHQVRSAFSNGPLGNDVHHSVVSENERNRVCSAVKLSWRRETGFQLLRAAFNKLFFGLELSRFLTAMLIPSFPESFFGCRCLNPFARWRRMP